MDHRGLFLVLNTASVFLNRATAISLQDGRSLDAKKNQGEVLARIHACSTKFMTSLVARVEE
jgi:spore maturation protein SpmA